mgnify:CR=1 FL=1
MPQIAIPMVIPHDPPILSHDDIREAFFRLYYASGVIVNTTYRGIDTLKCQLDLWLYQEMIHELKPDVIIETGSYKGGSAHFMADQLALNGSGHIFSVDIEWRERPEHPRISFLTGRSTDETIFEQIKRHIDPSDKVMVVLDGDHTCDYVLSEMLMYAPLVSSGHYLVVEDTVIWGQDGGPRAALAEFIKDNKDFEVDVSKHKFQITFMPYGFLRRK